MLLQEIDKEKLVVLKKKIEAFKKDTKSVLIQTAFELHKKSNDDLERELGDKATNRTIGIRYKPERFGDQNYNIQKLKAAALGDALHIHEICRALALDMRGILRRDLVDLLAIQ